MGSIPPCVGRGGFRNRTSQPSGEIPESGHGRGLIRSAGGRTSHLRVDESSNFHLSILILTEDDWFLLWEHVDASQSVFRCAGVDPVLASD